MIETKKYPNSSDNSKTTRYERNIPALSKEECEILRTKRILIAGCGGLGGYLIELMARIGIGSIRAVDGDVFEQSNLNRQLLSAPNLIGYPKANAAAERITFINPDVHAEGIHTYISEKNAESLIVGYDAVLDALDNISSRKILAKACSKVSVPFIHGAINGWVTQAGISMPGDNLIEFLYPEGTALNNKSVLSFTPAFCASIQASLCIRLLTGKPTETGVLYYYDLLDHDFEILHFNN